MSNFSGFIESKEDADKQNGSSCNEDADMQIGVVCNEDADKQIGAVRKEYARGIRQW